MKIRMLILLAAIVMATQCACAVPAELQGLTEEEIFNAIHSIAESGEANADMAEMTADKAKSAEPEADAAEYYDMSAAETVDQLIDAYNARCIEVSAPAKGSDIYHPVSIVQCACYDGDCYMVYPQVQDAAGADLINDTIRTKVAEQARALEVPVFACYKVEYNRNGIFSLRMLLHDFYGEIEECLSCVYMTFNVETGELYTLSDFFNSEDQSWRGRIPDIITTQAVNSNIVLLSDILPVSDDQPFYITEDGVVITYDLYEIATYSAGEPEFEIAVGELAEYIAPDGILNVFLTSAPTAETDVTPIASPMPPEPEGTPALEKAGTADDGNIPVEPTEPSDITKETEPDAEPVGEEAEETAILSENTEEDGDVAEP